MDEVLAPLVRCASCVNAIPSQKLFSGIICGEIEVAANGLVEDEKFEKRSRGWLQRKMFHEGVLLVETL